MHGDPVIDIFARHLRAADRLASPGPVGEPDQDDIERAVALRDDLLTHNVRIIAPVPDPTVLTAVIGIARVMTANGVTAEQAAGESDVLWNLAASLAGVDDRPGREMRRMVIDRLASTAHTPDPFVCFKGSDR
jgi:hypothetical protein